MSVYFTLSIILLGRIINGIRYNDIKLPYSRTLGTEWTEIIEPYLNGGDKPESIPLLRQHPGLAILDFNNDGNLDIFISNGPGVEHSLFVNKGNLEFEDIGINAGFGDIKSINQDGSGVCFGDINNDNYTDLLVLGRNDLNYLYKNLGNGQFELLLNSGINQDVKQFHSSSCSFGDINNDGYIDVVIGNAADTSDVVTISSISTISKNPDQLIDPYQYNQHNELYINNGDDTFNDISDRISDTKFDDIKNNYNGIYNGKATITWAILMVDINNDGYIDIIHADDNLGTAPPRGYPKGLIHVFINDRNGNFTDMPNTIFGYFMGISSADINCDGHLDLFLSDMGGLMASRWYFGDGNGRFIPGGGDRFVSPFGWGNAIFDYDNDGDLDVLFHGGMEVYEGMDENNPGTIFENIDGCFNEYIVPSVEQLFTIDPTCVDQNGNQISKCTIHVRRNVRGLAIGDINNDGFYDIITSSNQYFGTDFPPPHFQWLSDFNRNSVQTQYFKDTNFYFQHYINRRTGEPESWRPQKGDLIVEIADSLNNNNYFHVIIKGSKDILPCANINRAAIGVLLNVGHVTIPIEGGSSHLSQNSLQKIFGMGSQENVNLLIKYPYKDGGYIVNKLNDINPQENLILYEIPCDYDSKDENLQQYTECVVDVLCTLNKDEYINDELMNRLYMSALDTNQQIECNDGSNFCQNGNAFKLI